MTSVVQAFLLDNIATCEKLMKTTSPKHETKLLGQQDCLNTSTSAAHFPSSNSVQRCAVFGSYGVDPFIDSLRLVFYKDRTLSRDLVWVYNLQLLKSQYSKPVQPARTVRCGFFAKDVLLSVFRFQA